MNLDEKLQQLPTSAGVYQYFDKDGKLLYIGKAKVLKNRVKSYFKFTPTLAPADKLGPRIYKMISEVQSLEYIVVDNENDALILENSLIKQLKPKYNILLRDDKTYPYIYIDYSEDFPRLDITRKVLKGKGIKYFGPYSTGARDMLDSIYEILPLVQKKSCIKAGKACLFYQMEKCLAPCEGKVSKDEYKKLLDEAIGFLQNKTTLLSKLQDKMISLSTKMRFEEAMDLRDRIKTIEKSQVQSTLDFAKDEDYDLFTVKLGVSKAVVIRMFIRGGKLISTNHNYINISQDMQELDEIYKSALVNYYSSDLPFVPKNILIGDTLEEIEDIEAFISSKYSMKVKLSIPKIGIKKQLLDVAFKNCDELLKLQKDTKITLYDDIKKLFSFESEAKRFECFDNSHMMGQATVGAMIVWDDNNFTKDDYRLYNLEQKDEYAQMRELLTRRVEKFEQNPPPDMWVIDGGLTLLKLANDICQSVGVNIDMVAISKEKVDAKAHRAKGSAKDILYTLDDIFKLSTSDKRLQFCQRLRDEAHRSAINFHKKQKRKEDKQISLLDIKGIGKAKVTKLLNYFGTFELVKNSSVDQLKEVLNEKDSILIYNHFKDMDK
ncbi:MAG: excinuclease ABC subunit UvrC [Campylobacteraceae bacterium]|jgi:excinuclease ABC subunit C|nr:excinuclease ABC subunit UvrC [Campylobacteraceae bacterium]MBT4178855.1 excinuclease ABC subunit UvrC [Campylobacteraceae bacterium]MBT5323455.1 excinuclease ABC subunit UvrC [Campylobacteraceae bacterium]MBT6388652.1 excinuclease ABC subunit UvrC [Campylobacteraceae bacterium]MBT7273693.1 excinuclease ABC subunit UvrC [Campylobacteraceae bacterium]